jgi:hypothetical protein
MPTVNDEMKEIADYAVKSARDRYKKDLDFSEQSLIILDNILTKIYWGFSGRTEEDGESGLVYNTALIWGSYLGEYMIFKWGGKWIMKGSDRLVSINNIEFSPIKLIYQKISDLPQLSVEDYLNDAKRLIYTSVVNPQNAQNVAKKNEQLIEQITGSPAKQPVSINRRTLYIIGGVVGALVIITGIVMGYTILRPMGFPAIGAGMTSTSTTTQLPTQVPSTPTLAASDTPVPTVTPLPTYTPLPTETPSPTYTPSPTFTEIPSSTPTETQTPFIPTNTLRPTNPPTSTRVPPTNPPPPTVPPVVITSCEVNPSIVEPDINQRITFVVHFSAPGYSFDAQNDSGYPGQSGCSGTDDDGDSVAFCDGMSGEIKPNTTVSVLITSSVGNCSTGYHTP